MDSGMVGCRDTGTARLEKRGLSRMEQKKGGSADDVVGSVEEGSEKVGSVEKGGGSEKDAWGVRKRDGSLAGWRDGEVTGCREVDSKEIKKPKEGRRKQKKQGSGSTKEVKSSEERAGSEGRQGESRKWNLLRRD